MSEIFRHDSGQIWVEQIEYRFGPNQIRIHKLNHTGFAPVVKKIMLSIDNSKNLRIELNEFRRNTDRAIEQGDEGQRKQLKDDMDRVIECYIDDYDMMRGKPPSKSRKIEHEVDRAIRWNRGERKLLPPPGY